MFITVSVLYRPVEQLLSRTIADRDARGVAGHEHLRVAATIQLALGVLFVVVALALRGPIEDELLGGSSSLYTILIVAVLAYAASYFARGFLAGHRRFGLYGGLVLLEATSRFMFALAVAVGIAEGQTAVACGIAAAPIVSLAIVPWALGRRLRAEPDVDTDALDAAARDEPSAKGDAQFTLAHGSGFARRRAVIMLSEQTFLNAGPLLVQATEGSRGAALAGFTFNVLLIARAPLQLFQAVQTSILPHLTRLRASRRDRPVPAQRQPHADRDRGVRRLRRARDARDRPVGHGPAVRGQFRLRPRRPRAGLDRHGAVPVGRHAQPGAAGARPRAAGRDGVGRLRGHVRAVPAAGGVRRPRAPGRDRLPRRGRRVVCAASHPATGGPGMLERA